MHVSKGTLPSTQRMSNDLFMRWDTSKTLEPGRLVRAVARLSYLLSEINTPRIPIGRNLRKIVGEPTENLEKCRCFLRIIACEFRLTNDSL